MLNIFNIHKLYIKKNTLYNENKCYMHRVSSEGLSMALLRNNLMRSSLPEKVNIRSMRYIHSKTFKGPAKKFASDGSGKHPHVLETQCEKDTCSTQVCNNPCADKCDTKVKGHFSHKPPIGRNCKFVSQKDCNGEDDSQYFIRCIPGKTITGAQMKKCEQHILPHDSGTKFCKDNEELIRNISK